MSDPQHDPDHLDPPEAADAWLEQRYPAASADFVEKTLARVRADREQIEAEAQKVEEVQFDPAVLVHLQVPETAPDFVERTLEKVILQHRQRASGERALRDLVQQYEVPPVSEDFVRRTLTALGVATRRVVAPSRRRTFSWAAAAAALLLVASLVVGPLLVGPSPPVGRPTASYTPVRFGPVMATSARLQGERRGDGLLTLAYLGSLPGGDPGPVKDK